MKTLIRILIPFLLVPAILFSANHGKIPITTSSEKARTAYLQGRDIAEKLRAQDSAQYFRNAIQEDPKFAIAHLQLAFTQPSAQAFFDDVGKAVSLADQASEGEKLWILATDAGNKGLLNKQGEYLQKLVAAYPNDERAHNLLATYYFGLQQYDKAIQQYQKATAIDPQYSPAYNLLGYAYRFLSQYDKSEQAFKKYIELIPDDPNPYDSYAELLMKIGKYEESNENYRKALKLDPNFVNSYLAIASNFNFMGRHADARKELQRLLEIARNDGERRGAHFGMTVSYIDEGNWQKALEEQEKMLALARKMNDPATVSGDLNTIGIILLENGRAEEALSRFEQAAKVTADSNLSAEVKKNTATNDLYRYGRAALGMGDLKKAKSMAVELRKQAEAAKNQFLIWTAHELDGMIALKEKNYDQAIGHLGKANQQNPYNLYRSALAHQGKGDAAKAKELFERAAHFNVLSNLNLALIRTKAKQSLGNV